MALAICEVGPRDGLQNLDRSFSVAERVALIERLAAAGLRRIEAVSFVDPRRVPQMAHAEKVLDGLSGLDGVRLAGLVMNARGAERALSTRLHELRFVVVASETLSRRNQNAGTAEGIAILRDFASATRARGKVVTGVVAAAFGCPFEGEIDRARVSDIAAELVEAGADEIVLADTIGVGAPDAVRDLAFRCRKVLVGRPIGFHFHDTRSTGYANAVAAVEAGAAVLDTAIGGLGGCPFAPGAAGNIATEDLTHLLGRMGIETGLDLDALIAVASSLRITLPDDIAGRLSLAGGFPPRPSTRAQRNTAHADGRSA